MCYIMHGHMTPIEVTRLNSYNTCHGPLTLHTSFSPLQFGVITDYHNQYINLSWCYIIEI